MQDKKINYGIEILRIFFCYMVISFHFYGLMYGDNRFYFLRELAVPMFVFISFYFGYKTIVSLDMKKYGKRCVRLIVPYLFWGIVPYVGLWILSFLSLAAPTTKQEFLMQILFGSNERLNAPLWFIWEILVLTILFILIHFIFRKFTSIVLLILMIGAYVIQYSNVTYIFYTLQPYELYQNLGRLCEVLPLACAGYILADLKIMDKLEGKYRISIISLVLAAVCIFFVAYIPTPFITFAYAGVKHLIVTVLLFVGFYIIPFDKLPNKVTSVIKWLSGYTMGIYFMHWIVGRCMNAVWLRYFGVEKTLLETFVIFIACLIICVIIDLIPLKATKMLVR